MGQKLWICGKHTSGEFPENVWEFQGVYSTRDKAVAACRTAKYFIGTALLDETLPDQMYQWPDGEFPLWKELATPEISGENPPPTADQVARKPDPTPPPPPRKCER